MSGPRVRAVVVTWNGAHLLPACLDSLLAQDLGPEVLEVLVVDNASSDGTARLLAERYPSVRVLTLGANLGFAGGVAAGTADLLDAAAGGRPEYVALLNNDARFEPDAVRLLVKAADAAALAGEHVGAVTATVLLEERDSMGRVLVNSTGNVLTGTGAAADRDYRVPLDEVRPEREVFGFNGGACLLRTDALREAGGFDPSLFLYYEDTDLSWKLREHGWTVIHEHAARAHHRHMASTQGGVSPTFRYYNTRNSLVVMARHAPARRVLASYVRQSAGAVRRTVLGGEDRRVTLARWRGLRDALVPALRGVLRASRVRDVRKVRASHQEQADHQDREA
ncbi:glycosyltransferase family 2 protein [Xylanimonas allomyrinae]|uniref:Glycosyltransferase family 2 protein n=1 Tax=Xylanimonas allomyrinae TaxID=2509459 RepID=A0A4V0YE89_9MICO|nr:glycosyltransferase family 2 protein [Xylanimonas allomyrinae]